jgi:hypothetical protein
MTTENSESWGKIAEGAAKEIRIAPLHVSYIQARGFFGHVLLYLCRNVMEKSIIENLRACIPHRTSL